MYVGTLRSILYVPMEDMVRWRYCHADVVDGLVMAVGPCWYRVCGVMQTIISRMSHHARLPVVALAGIIVISWFIFSESFRCTAGEVLGVNL
jgi:hypothetical protein